MIDLMIWLTQQRPASVFSWGNSICTAGTQFRYNDFVASTLKFDSGLLGRITANFGCAHRHQHVVRIFGTKATFIYDDAGPRLHTTRDPVVLGSVVDRPTLPAHKGDLIPAFINAILNDEDWNQQTQEMFDVISVCSACDQAERCEDAVEVQYV